MKLKPEQLAGQLRGPLAPVYAFFSDEPFFLIEGENALRQAALQAGYAQTEVWTVDPGFDFARLEAERQSLSLFAERRLLILRLGAQKPGDQGGKQLQAWLVAPPEDIVLLVLGERPDAAGQKSAWFRALEEKAILVLFYPPENRQWPAWVAQRLRRAGLDASHDALALLAERSEGNLLACAQAIDMLGLLCQGRRLEREDVFNAIGDNAHFSVFELAAMALQGDARHALRMLEHLRQDGTEPILVLWALARELRLILALQGGVSDPARFWRDEKVFGTRQGVLDRCARQRSPADMQHALQTCARIDAAIKGRDTLPVWPALADLTLRLAGKKVHYPD